MTNWAKQRRQMERLGFVLDEGWNPDAHLFPSHCVRWVHKPSKQAIVLGTDEPPYSDAKIVDSVVSGAMRKAAGDIVDAFDSARIKVMGRIPERRVLRRGKRICA